MLNRKLQKSIVFAAFAGCVVMGAGRMASAQTAVDVQNQIDFDQTFVKNAAEGGMAEVKFGQLAAQKATNPDVKAFAQKMVDDHTALANQLTPVAQKMGVAQPAALDKKDQAEYDRLNALSGDAFDKAYVKAMVEDHKKDLRDFKYEASNTNNADLKQVAKQGSQVIQGHYQMVQKLAAEVGAGGGKGTTAGGQ
jgi:putative membrane protein